VNPRIRNLESETLSDNWYVLRKFTYEAETRGGTWAKQSREAYDRGNGATILLYNRAKQTVILTRQFRLPTYVNGNATGMLLEACAGLLDKDNPEVAIRREVEEETGYQLRDTRKLFEAYMSPGSVTEILYFFVAEYSDEGRAHAGGGIDDEEIEVVELPFDKAMRMIETGEIRDGKTIMLLQYAKIHNLMSES
jgi:GDP-mannose pyrophosphatase NudK